LRKKKYIYIDLVFKKKRFTAVVNHRIVVGIIVSLTNMWCLAKRVDGHHVELIIQSVIVAFIVD